MDHPHPSGPIVCLSRNQVTETPSTCIRIHSSTQDSSMNIGNRACIVKCAKFASILERSWLRTGFDLVTSPDKGYPDLASARFQIYSVFKKLLLWRADSESCGLVCPILRTRVNGSRVSGKLRIQKYLYTFGRGLGSE